MKEEIYHSQDEHGDTHARAWLTDELAESRYGIPVLLIEYKGEQHVYGWGDVMPSGLSGGDFIRIIAEGHAGNHTQITEEGQAALQRALDNIAAMGY